MNCGQQSYLNARNICRLHRSFGQDYGTRAMGLGRPLAGNSSHFVSACRAMMLGYRSVYLTSTTRFFLSHDSTIYFNRREIVASVPCYWSFRERITYLVFTLSLFISQWWVNRTDMLWQRSTRRFPTQTHYNRAKCNRKPRLPPPIFTASSQNNISGHWKPCPQRGQLGIPGHSRHKTMLRQNLADFGSVHICMLHNNLILPGVFQAWLSLGVSCSSSWLLKDWISTICPFSHIDNVQVQSYSTSVNL